jgi:hypothetical protein
MAQLMPLLRERLSRQAPQANTMFLRAVGELLKSHPIRRDCVKATAPTNL